MSHSVCCECSHVMLTEELRALPVSICPKCGNKIFSMTVHYSLEHLPNSTIRIKQRDMDYKSDKKLRREYFVGMQPNKDGLLMVKERIIDKDANIYFEFVKNPETNEVIRHVQESLTDHKNRGSAKKKGDGA